MTKQAFVEAEQVLNLHKATLSSFLVDATHSRYLSRDSEENLSKIGTRLDYDKRVFADVIRSCPQSSTKVRDRELWTLSVLRCQDQLDDSDTLWRISDRDSLEGSGPSCFGYTSEQSSLGVSEPQGADLKAATWIVTAMESSFTPSVLHHC